MGNDAIQFTQDQARALSGASAEALRHWKKVVPYLRDKAGKSARFSFADVLGLAATRELVATFGVHIASISIGVNTLFRLLSETRPATLEDSVAVVTPREAWLFSSRDLTFRRQNGPALIVPLEPLISRLREQMLPAALVERQDALPFPPRVVRSSR
jgi:hypothetical protein